MKTNSSDLLTFVGLGVAVISAVAVVAIGPVAAPVVAVIGLVYGIASEAGLNEWINNQYNVRKEFGFQINK